MLVFARVYAEAMIAGSCTRHDWTKTSWFNSQHF